MIEEYYTVLKCIWTFYYSPYLICTENWFYGIREIEEKQIDKYIQETNWCHKNIKTCDISEIWWLPCWGVLSIQYVVRYVSVCWNVDTFTVYLVVRLTKINWSDGVEELLLAENKCVFVAVLLLWYFHRTKSTKFNSLMYYVRL